MIEELDRPNAVDQAEQATEVLRAWVADEHLQATLDPLAFEEAEVWGLLLADLARHIANSWAQAASGDPVELFQEIVAAFNDEVGKTATAKREESGEE